MSPRFQLQLERERYKPGETVRGTLLVVEGGASRSLEVWLDYNEETDDYLEAATSISSGLLHEGDLTTGTSFEFEFTLPADALPNYKSEHGELYWDVNVKSDEFGPDTWERRRIEIEPTGAARARAELAPRPPSRPQTGKASKIRFDHGGAGKARVSSDGLLRWLWRAFFAGGVVLLIAGAVWLVRTVQFVAEAEHATGTVIDLSRETDSDGTDVFYPVVRFTTAEGKTIEFVSSSGSSPPSESPGDRVEVLYDPDDPYAAQLSGFFHLWLFPPIPLVIGAGFIGAAWFLRRQTRESSAADVD